MRIAVDTPNGLNIREEIVKPFPIFHNIFSGLLAPHRFRVQHVAGKAGKIEQGPRRIIKANYSFSTEAEAPSGGEMGFDKLHRERWEVWAVHTWAISGMADVIWLTRDHVFTALGRFVCPESELRGNQYRGWARTPWRVWDKWSVIGKVVENFGDLTTRCRRSRDK